MLKGFVTMEYILTFAGMIVVVNLLTQFTKGLFDKIGWNRTKYVVAGYSFLLCTVAAITQGKFATAYETLETCLVWTVNSIIVWFTAMKAYETIAEERPVK